MTECLACNLIAKPEKLPGGRIFATKYWIVEHCVGPLGVGTLIVKPFRHCVNVTDLTEEEALEMGPLLQKAASIIRELTCAEQVYICLWSHAGWELQHIHYVLQPIMNSMKITFDKPGPYLQSTMFTEKKFPDREEVETFVEKVKEQFNNTNILPKE